MPFPPSTAARPAPAPSPASVDDPLLEPRFRVPAAPADLVVRRRLLDLVERGTHRPLTLVSAPAGYGKTVLLASWAERVGPTATVVHLAMDDQDESSRGLLGVGGRGAASQRRGRLRRAGRRRHGRGRPVDAAGARPPGGRARAAGGVGAGRAGVPAVSRRRRRGAPPPAGLCGAPAAGPADAGRPAVAAAPVPAGAGDHRDPCRRPCLHGHGGGRAHAAHRPRPGPRRRGRAARAHERLAGRTAVRGDEPGGPGGHPRRPSATSGGTPATWRRT